VADAVSRDGIAERLHHVLLADNFGPALRAIFSIEGLGHSVSSDQLSVIDRGAYQDQQSI
jgi:hypothetical protein